MHLIYFSISHTTDCDEINCPDQKKACNTTVLLLFVWKAYETTLRSAYRAICTSNKLLGTNKTLHSQIVDRNFNNTKIKI